MLTSSTNRDRPLQDVLSARVAFFKIARFTSNQIASPAAEDAEGGCRGSGKADAITSRVLTRLKTVLIDDDFCTMMPGQHRPLIDVAFVRIASPGSGAVEHGADDRGFALKR